MRPAYGMGRRSFSRPGALRFTAAPCSRLAKRRAVQQGGRPAIHSGAAPASRPRGDRRRGPAHGNPQRPAAHPPLHNNPRRSAAQPPFDPTSGGQPDSATQTRFTATPDDRSRNGGQTGTAATRRAAVPCALLHKPAGPPPLCALSHNSPELPRPAVPSHNPPGHQRAPPSPSGKSAYQFPRLARPPPPGNANHAPGARRCACPTATSVPWRGHPARAASPRKEGGPPKIYFFSSPNTP